MSTKTFLGTVLFELKKTFSDSKHGICQNCYNPNTDRDWCQPCNAEKFRQNFSNWTSGNKHIDMFIQDAQVTASNHDEVLEWIPNDQLNKVTFIANGKYSTNYKAIWSKGDIIQWDHEKNDWSRFNGSISNWSYSQDNSTGLNGRIVALKSFQDSSDICSELEKLRHYLQSLKEAIKNDSMLLPLYGITQHPKTSEYMIVTSYAEGSSLRNNLQYIRKLSWKERLEILLDIAYGLAGLHKSNLLHRNLHSGNVFLFKSLDEKCDRNYSMLGDISLPQSINYYTSNHEDFYDFLPYVAPEVLRGNLYTKSADIYSFGLLMWELTSGESPFSNIPHDKHLSFDICSGVRPEIFHDIPQCFSALMKRCWSMDPFNRPSAITLCNIFEDWCEYYDDNIKDIDDKNIQLPIMQFQHADKLLRSQSKHSSNFYAPYYTNFGFSSYKTYDNKKDQTRYYY